MQRLHSSLSDIPRVTSRGTLDGSDRKRKHTKPASAATLKREEVQTPSQFQQEVRTWAEDRQQKK